LRQAYNDKSDKHITQGLPSGFDDFRLRQKLSRTMSEEQQASARVRQERNEEKE